MAVKSRQDLVYRALKNLGVLPQGETPSAQEYDAVNEHVTAMFDGLASQDVYFLENIEAIPDDVFLSLGHVLAWTCAAEFGAGQDPALASLATQAEQRLQAIQAVRPTYKPLEIQAY